MIFPIDRLQYSRNYNKFFIYEFIKVPYIDNTISALYCSNFWNDLYSVICPVDQHKIDFIRSLSQKINKYIIIYQDNIEDKFLSLYCESPNNNFKSTIDTFDSLCSWFNDLNSIDGITNSKVLGSVRKSNQDTYTNSLIKELYNLETYDDDCGLELTKKLLKNNQTRGFDIDLFQYIPSTGEYIFYEFLKRENSYINNIQAHPNRYCWTNSPSDNKMKFISLWNAKNYFGGKLYLINYSDNDNEKISICEILELDDNRGILSENKYCMSKNIFLSWLKDMNNYNKNHNNYLSDFKCIHYSNDFFENWKNNKDTYGNDFFL